MAGAIHTPPRAADDRGRAPETGPVAGERLPDLQAQAVESCGSESHGVHHGYPTVFEFRVLVG